MIRVLHADGSTSLVNLTYVVGVGYQVTERARADEIAETRPAIVGNGASIDTALANYADNAALVGPPI